MSGAGMHVSHASSSLKLWWCTGSENGSLLMSREACILCCPVLGLRAVLGSGMLLSSRKLSLLFPRQNLATACIGVHVLSDETG